MRIFAQQQIALLPAIPPVAYLLGVLYQLSDRQFVELFKASMPWLVLSLGVSVPLAGIHLLVDRTLRESENDAPGDRLRRILTLPRQVELLSTGCYLLGIVIFTVVACRMFGKPLSLLGPTVVVALVLLALILVRQTLKIEEVLRPLAVAEFARHPDVHPRGAGFLWPRQIWYLPYVTSVVLLASFVALAVIVTRRFQGFVAATLEELRRLGHESLVAQVPERTQQFLNSLVLPAALCLGYVLVLGAITALAVARRHGSGSRAVETAVLALAAGTPRLPEWPATDELGDLAFATAGALSSLQQRALTIGDSARTVDEVARQLSSLVTRQMEVLQRQSEVLLQTQQTAEEIRHTTELASEKARAVLTATESAEEVGRSGRAAVEASLEQLGDIRGHATATAGHVAGLEARARRIARITLVVKDLADQSNVVALNAAIEATRAGENGRTFSIVAQQIRRLADASNTATDQVRDVLRDVQAGLKEAVRLSGAGRDQADTGLSLARGYGEDLRRLSQIVGDNAGAARQISAAVSQQSAGVAQIFEAITSLGRAMRETVDTLRTTEAITSRARLAADQVAGAMAGYRFRT